MQINVDPMKRSISSPSCVDKADVAVTMANGMLTIKGEKKQKKEDKDDKDENY